MRVRKGSIIEKKLKKRKKKAKPTIGEVCIKMFAEGVTKKDNDLIAKAERMIDENKYDFLNEIFCIPGIRRMIQRELRKRRSDIRLGVRYEGNKRICVVKSKTPL